MTAEDPVEYNLKGVNQVQVNDGIGRTFATVLRLQTGEHAACILKTQQPERHGQFRQQQHEHQNAAAFRAQEAEAWSSLYNSQDC